MGRVMDEEELVTALELERSEGRKVAFANGCFDLIHVGHVRYLREAAGVADVLVVGVNGDESVRELKGEGRPFAPSEERAEIIAAFEGVGYVVIFPDRTVHRLLDRIRPDFQCKGTDYTPDSVPEAELMRSWGGRVVIVGDPKDHSSTGMVSNLRKTTG